MEKRDNFPRLGIMEYLLDLYTWIEQTSRCNYVIDIYIRAMFFIVVYTKFRLPILPLLTWAGLILHLLMQYHEDICRASS